MPIYGKILFITFGKQQDVISNDNKGHQKYCQAVAHDALSHVHPLSSYDSADSENAQTKLLLVFGAMFAHAVASGFRKEI